MELDKDRFVRGVPQEEILIKSASSMMQTTNFRPLLLLLRLIRPNVAIRLKDPRLTCGCNVSHASLTL